MIRFRVALLSAAVIMSFVACGGANQSSSTTSSATAAPVSDPKKVAVGKAVDAKSSILPIACYKPSHGNVKHLSAMVLTTHGSSTTCTMVYAGKTYHLAFLGNSISGAEYGVPVGNYIVDKLGAEQMIYGTKATPYRGHFVMNELGQAFYAAGEFKLPPTTGVAELLTDADGNWVAQL